MRRDQTLDRSVLVVDDDADIRDMLRALLEDEGYTVLEAGDGVVALHLLRTSPARLVVLIDHTMPQLNGAGLVTEVLADPLLSTQRAYIYMTAADRHLSPALVWQLEALDAPTLRKPFDIEQLLDLVAAAAVRLQTEDGAAVTPP